MPDILEQLGVNVPPPPVGGLGAQPGKPPMAEMSAPADLGGIRSLADTLIVGALELLTQALSLEGSASDRGDTIIRAIGSLRKIVPPEKVKEAQANIAQFLGGIAQGAQQGMPPVGGPAGAPGAPPAGMPPGAPPGIPEV